MNYEQHNRLSFEAILGWLRSGATVGREGKKMEVRINADGVLAYRRDHGDIDERIFPLSREDIEANDWRVIFKPATFDDAKVWLKSKAGRKAYRMAWRRESAQRSLTSTTEPGSSELVLHWSGTPLRPELVTLISIEDTDATDWIMIDG